MVKKHRIGITLLIMAVLLILPHKSFPQKPFITRMRFTLPVQEPVFHTVIQDKKGYLWLGSDQGLYRFDGQSFIRSYPSADSTDPHVTALFEDHEGTLWIGCKDGSISYLKQGSLYRFSPEEGTSSAGISSILVDSSGTLWWSTLGEGIYFYTGKRVYNINHEDGLSDDYVYQIMEDGHGKVLAATDNGLSRVWYGNGEKNVEVPFAPGALPDIIVKRLAFDQSGLLWLGFHDAGAGFFDSSLSLFQVPRGFSGWSSGPVDNFVFSGSTVWLGTQTGEVLQIDPEQPELMLNWRSDDRGNPFGRIHQLLEDREGNIWILASGGLFRSSGTRIQFFGQDQTGSFHDIHAVLRDSRRNLWYCNDNGIFNYDFSRKSTKSFLLDPQHKGVHFMCLQEDPYGFIWAGTFDYGLFRLDPKSSRYRQVTEYDGLVNNNVLSISIHNDTLWMATLGGASSIVIHGKFLDSPLEIASFNQDNGLVNTFIYDVYEDELDRIWFATDGDGICFFEKDRFHYFGEPDGIGDDVVYSITGDGMGNIWFSTSSDGIYKFDGSIFKRYGIESGLRSLEISSLAVSGENVMIVHGLGIDVLHLPDMGFSYFGKESGLTDMSPELNAIYPGPGGNFWIGTKTGIVQYHCSPDNYLNKPETILDRMSVFLEPVQMEANLSLRASRNYVSFNYSGIWLSDPEKVVYRVYLEGYDLDWKETYDRSATYSSLPPGKYTFYVRSALDPSFNQSSEASFSFSVSKPFWANPLFIILLAITFALAIYLVVKYRERKLKAIEQQKKEKVEFEFQLLKNQVNPHFLFNSFSTLISLIEDDGIQAKEYTEKLSDFFRRVLEVKDNEVIPLSEELDLISDYIFILQKRYGNMVRLENNLQGKVLQSFIPPMTMQILMENAVKHNIISKDQHLIIRIYHENDWLVVENSFQPKRKTEVSTGIGLMNISKRYRLLNQRDIEIEQTNDLFRVKLPVI